MPLYDYTCDACGSKMEEFQRMADSHLTKCPICRKPKLRRVIGAPTIRTDTSFLAGVGTLRHQFEDNDDELGRVVKAARQQGYEPKASDYYAPSIANRCGDPGAFIPHHTPTGDIRRICEKRDLACDGAVKVKRRAK